MKREDPKAMATQEARASMLVAQTHLRELVAIDGTDSTAGRALDYLRAAIDALSDDLAEDEQS